MDDDARLAKELPLLPDSELLRLVREVRSETRQMERSGDRVRRRRDVDRKIDALERELEARGMEGPPWWSELRHHQTV